MAGEEYTADILILSSAIGSGHMRASGHRPQGGAGLDRSGAGLPVRWMVDDGVGLEPPAPGEDPTSHPPRRPPRGRHPPPRREGYRRFTEVDRSHTIAAVSHITRDLKEAGYSFLILPELLNLGAGGGAG